VSVRLRFRRYLGAKVRSTRRYLNEVATVGPSDGYASEFHYFGERAALMAPQGVIYNERYLSIGDETLIGPNVCLTAGISADQTMLSSPVVSIGKKCIIGRGSHIIGHWSIVLGDELAGCARAFVREAPVNDETLALDEIKAIGPGGSFLASRYTRRHYREFWMSDLFDHSMHDRWAAAGEQTLKQRIQAKVQRLRAAERPFVLTPEQQAGLEAILTVVQAHQSERI